MCILYVTRFCAFTGTYNTFQSCGGGWWLVAGDWWLVTGGWWLVAAQKEISDALCRFDKHGGCGARCRGAPVCSARRPDADDESAVECEGEAVCAAANALGRA